MPAAFSIPVTHTDYRNRARIAREREILPKTKRTLHKSFGITSQVIRRTPENSRNVTGKSVVSLKAPHMGQVTSKTVIPWTWPETTTEEVTSTEMIRTTTENSSTEDVTTTKRSMLPPWLPTNPKVSSQSVTISDLLTPQSSVFNSTITLIKEFFKDKRKKLKGKRGSKRKQAKSSKTLTQPLYTSLERSMYNRETPQLNFKFIDSEKNVPPNDEKSDRGPKVMPYPIAVKKKKRPQKLQMGEPLPDAQTPDSTGSVSIEDLGARIEAEEAERQRADGENPLKYVVKDGILFKKNKMPVARLDMLTMNFNENAVLPPMVITHPDHLVSGIGLTSVDPLALPPAADKFRKVQRTSKTQTMVESSPFINELVNPVVNHAAVVNLKKYSAKRPRPIAPLSPPTLNLQPLLFAAPTEFNNKIRDDPRPSALSLSHELETEPVDLAKNDLIRDIHSPPPYPFSHCYMNIDGFMCCNRYLESLMRRSFRKLRRAHRFHECSVQKIANRIQTDCENVFNTTFEVVVGIDDFAIRAHFAGDLMCKIQEGGRFLTAYATVMPSREGVAQDPLHVVTKIEMNLRDREEHQLGDSIQFPERQLDSAVQPIQIHNDVRRRNRAQDIPFHEKSREDIDNDNMITRS
ncbi:ground-like domain protein [Ancylostoma ceylanicum]|uniref:Ground-like domain protein n=1 Tax=Ancylostoma ceylanicum TaxID=53326 RepID=A0A0D6M2R6_9BILA|nr:ground-like domain protein [Ancylostoma ceylanicum]